MMRALTKLLTTALFFTTALAHASCEELVAYGFPDTHLQSQLQNPARLCRIHYVVEHNELTKTPTYSAEILIAENFSTKVPRINAFKADPSLDKGKRAELSDYLNAPYDRGHMSPADNVHESTAAMRQTFYLSNMVPQDSALNRGAWRQLETQARKWTKKYGTLYVITGPIYDEGWTTIGANKVGVPTRLYKVIVDKSSKQGVGFITSNNRVSKDWKLWAVPIGAVEKATGINFFPELPAAGRASIINIIGSRFK